MSREHSNNLSGMALAQWAILMSGCFDDESVMCAMSAVKTWDIEASLRETPSLALPRNTGGGEENGEEGELIRAAGFEDSAAGAFTGGLRGSDSAGEGTGGTEMELSGLSAVK